MKDFEKVLKHLYSPPIPKSVLDSLTPLKAIQDRNKMLFGILDSSISRIVKNALAPYETILKASQIVPPQLNLPEISGLQKLSNAYAFNYADSILKRHTEISKMFNTSFLDSLMPKNILGSHFEEIQKMTRFSGIGVINSLKMFDDELFKNVSSIINQFQIDPSAFEELLNDTDTEQINAYSLRSVFEYLRVKAPELLTLENAVYFLIGMIVQTYLQQFWRDHIVGPNICIARSGCRIREDGTTNSRIKTVVPNGEEILVLENHGPVKKVFWKKKTGEVYEGWSYSSTMQWKYKKIAKDIIQ